MGMARPPFPHSLREFQRQFASEEACQEYLAACRWPDGFKCPRCGNQRAYVMKATLAMHGVPTSGVSDIGDYSPQYQSIVGVVVLGGVLDDNG